MFKDFYKHFNVPKIEENRYCMKAKIYSVENLALGFNELLNNYQGNSFGGGIYRLHNYDDIKKWNEIVSDAFPEFKERIQCFGYDWLGRQFSIDKTRILDGQPQILMFEPGTGEALEIPCNFIQFHNDEIPNYHEACLASEFFHDWMKSSKNKLDKKSCVGYKVLLFLGGDDIVENLEVSDMEVYWSICSQMIKNTKNLEDEAKIDEIKISD
ncbi:T6SS immunity protein Tdi1 domain-containing protein [Clostridium sp.]|uniref:T6SS immunity protein Tdi1 domain-containing protein n=1 Tax=Clostridium sp. TaxID=1506 RepID=UPI002605CFA2|nr:T6SS immunity protein Tdi1 domain-containing protein [Clostridium sp.]